MMPKGPFGGPRITELFPFSSDEVEVSFHEERNSPSVIPLEFEELLESLEMPKQSIVHVERDVIIRQRPDKTGIGILDEIKGEIAEMGERGARINYYIADNKIAYMAKTEVDQRFRRRGIGSALRSGALEDMKGLGVETVYSYPVTDAGKALVKSQGFTKSDVSGLLRPYYSKDL